MAKAGLRARARAIREVWPLWGALFLLLAFLVTLVWFADGLFGFVGENTSEWLEPLAAILGGIGAFLVATILIFRRVENAAPEAESYGLARGLATAYYFNYVRPLSTAIRDPAHSIHEMARTDCGATEIAGIVVGIPVSMTDFDPDRHDALYARLAGALTDLTRKPDPATPATAPKATSAEAGKEFAGYKIVVRDIPGRPRGISPTLMVVKPGKAVIVDIPTILAVIPDLASFVATTDVAAATGDERIAAARSEVVAASEVTNFQELLEAFQDISAKAGAQEPRGRSPVTLLHIVPLARLERRMQELTAA